MGSNGVVSIRVEALGVSITIAEGSIAIEQSKAQNLAVSAAPRVESDRHSLTGPPEDGHQTVVESQGDCSTNVPASGKGQEARATGRQLSKSPRIPLQASPADTQRLASAIPARPSQNRNGPAGLPSDSGKDQQTQTKPLWSDEEAEKLRALYPTHSASAIAKQLGRGRNSVRSKAQNLGLRKAAPPTVIVKSSPPEPKPAPKPRPLSAAVTADSTPGPGQNGAAGPGFSSVSLLDHHLGQCRWIISDVWPVMYCGAPVVDSSSWCEQHSTRVFNLRPQGLDRMSLPESLRDSGTGLRPTGISRRFR
jgi:hypothetical protein